MSDPGSGLNLSAAHPIRVEDATWHRLSPRMLLVHPVTEVGRALPALVGLFFAGGPHDNGRYWGLVGAAVVAALSLSRWFTTRLRITPENVQLRRGLVVRKTLTTSRERIRTVDVTSHLLHRILGLARVVVGTGTNDRKGEGRIQLDGLPTKDAQQLRDDLLHRRAPVEPEGAPATTVEPTAFGECELARLDRRWIRYAPFTLSGVLTGLVLWGFYWRIQGESGVDLTKRGPLQSVSGWLGALPVTAAVLVVLAALLMFVTVTSTVGYVLAFWNFRLVRHDGGTLQVTRGLITTRATSIEHRRLVGVQLSEPLGLRMVGAARLLVVATGLRTGRGAERGGETLLPPAPFARAA
ncbi:MAG: PH domain-containing protein, partial [Actinomycetota bacterium]|nr:PH domain-containing protein [Actinomycetota bacterium]